jgi:replicative DNA helicase
MLGSGRDRRDAARKDRMTRTATGLSKIPPYSVHSEKVVVASLLAEPALIPLVSPILGTGDVFFRLEHGRVYDAMLAATRRSRKISSEKLIATLAEERILDRNGDPGPLNDLAAAGEPEPRAISHARIVAEKARMRLLVDAISDMFHDAYHNDDGFTVVLARARERLAEVKRRADAIS